MMRHFLRRAVLGAAAVLALGGGLSADEEIRPRFAMHTDPELHVPEKRWKLPDRAIALWREALTRPDSELQRLAAESIVKAHSNGFPGLDAARPELIQAVSSEISHPAARFAAARALLALDARDAAPMLAKAAQSGDFHLRQLIEPALAEWDYQPLRPLWRQRLLEANAHRRELLLAARCAAQVRDAQALAPLLEMALGKRPPDVRLAAARAAGAIAESGLEERAGALMRRDDATILDRLCAAALLARHASTDAQGRLLELARDAEPSIAAAALATLQSIDPALTLPLAEEAMRNADPIVRQRGADAYLALPTAERMLVVATLLDDPHPEVRGGLREALFRLAKRPELDSAIRQGATDVLVRDGWRGQEQAGLLLAALDHKPAADRLVELLESERSEVMVTAAWALRQLAVNETLPKMLDKASRQTDLRLAQPATAPGALDHQVAYLFEAMGQMRYAPAELLMRRYIPKDYSYGELSRGAAIWALGHLHAGKADEDLARQFVDRLFDASLLPPEIPIVFLTSAISLGRMKAQSQLARLHEYVGPTVEPFDLELAARWAIQEISGEALPILEPPLQDQGNWPLQPLAD